MVLHESDYLISSPSKSSFLEAFEIFPLGNEMMLRDIVPRSVSFSSTEVSPLSYLPVDQRGKEYPIGYLDDSKKALWLWYHITRMKITRIQKVFWWKNLGCPGRGFDPPFILFFLVLVCAIFGINSYNSLQSLRFNLANTGIFNMCINVQRGPIGGVHLTVWLPSSPLDTSY